MFISIDVRVNAWNICQVVYVLLVGVFVQLCTCYWWSISPFVYVLLAGECVYVFTCYLLKYVSTCARVTGCSICPTVYVLLLGYLSMFLRVIGWKMCLYVGFVHVCTCLYEYVLLVGVFVYVCTRY